MINTDEPRESVFLYQRFSVLTKRCNTVAFVGTFTTSEDEM